MIKKYGPWTIKNSTKTYQDHWVEVVKDEIVSPSGREGLVCTVNLSPRVYVLPIDDENFIYLKDDFCYTAGENIVAAIGGGLEQEEQPEEAAQRILKEELFLKTVELQDYGLMISAYSVVKLPVYLFGARGLRPSSVKRNGALEPGIIKISLDKALDMVMDNKITHAATALLIVKTEKFLSAIGSAKYKKLKLDLLEMKKDRNKKELEY